MAALAVVTGIRCTSDSTIMKRSRGEFVPKGRADAGDAAGGGDSSGGGDVTAGGAGSASGAHVGGAGFSRGATASPPVRTDETVAFVCSHWEDDDRDGVMDYPDEFRGIGASFRTTDRIAVCFQTRVTRAYRRTFRLYGGDRSVVLERSKDLPGSSVLKMTVLQYESEQLAAGSYEASWSVDGGVAATARFEVVE